MGCMQSCITHSLRRCADVTPFRLSLRPLLGALLLAPRVFLPLKGLMVLGMCCHTAERMAFCIKCRACTLFCAFCAAFQGDLE